MDGMVEGPREGMLETGNMDDKVVVGRIEGVLEVVQDGLIDGMKVGQAEGLLVLVVVFTLLGLIVVGRLVRLESGDVDSIVDGAMLGDPSEKPLGFKHRPDK